MQAGRTAPWLKWLDRLGINALFRHLNRRRPLILWYHGICADDFTLLRGYDVRQLPVGLFRRQLEHLCDHGYRFVSQDELMDALESGRSTKRLVTLSIDDGLRNVITRGYPLMREFGAKGTLYVVPDLVDSGEILWTDRVETVVRRAPRGEFRFELRGEILSYMLDDEASNRSAMRSIKRRLRSLPDRERRRHLEQFPPVTSEDAPAEFDLAGWEELRRLDPAVLALGNHTSSHPDCARLEEDGEILHEIWHAGLEIEKRVGYPVRHFCYPAGSHDDRVVSKVRDYGYRSAVTTREGFADAADDPLLLRRIEAEDEWYRFLATSSGAFGFITGLKASLTGGKRRVERAPLPEPTPLSIAAPTPSGGGELETPGAARD